MSHCVCVCVVTEWRTLWPWRWWRAPSITQRRPLMRLNCCDVWASDQCDISVFGIPVLFIFLCFVFFHIVFAPSCCFPFLSFIFLFAFFSISLVCFAPQPVYLYVNKKQRNTTGHLSCIVCAEDSHLRVNFLPASVFPLFLFSSFHLFLSFIFSFFFLSCLLHLLVSFSSRWERATPATPTRTWWFNW